MRKLMLYVFAAFMLTSCDNIIKKKTDDDDKETSKKMKKTLDDDESSDDDTPKKKKKTDVMDEDDDTKTVKHKTYDNSDDDENTNRKTTNYSSGWSSAEKEAFMTNCVGAAKGTMGATKAEDYCSCMEEKIEKLYPNAEDSKNLSSTKMTDMARECLQQ